MLRLIFFIFLLLPLTTNAITGPKQAGEALSKKWSLGPNLIYDCKEGHFACVNSKGRNNCQFEAENDAKLGQRFLSCRFLKKLGDISLCQAEQLKLINRAGKIDKNKTICRNK